MRQDTTERARSFLLTNSLGVLATSGPEGAIHARTVYYAGTDAFEVYFLTLAGTRKVEDINTNHHAAFVVSDPDIPCTLQLEGTISAQPDTSVIDPIVQKLMETFMAKGNTFAPLTHLDAESILFYKLTPNWIRFGDFSNTSGTDEAFSVITP